MVGPTNHFIELQEVEEIFEPEIAAKLGVSRRAADPAVSRGRRGAAGRGRRDVRPPEALPQADPRGDGGGQAALPRPDRPVSGAAQAAVPAVLRRRLPAGRAGQRRRTPADAGQRGRDELRLRVPHRQLRRAAPDRRRCVRRFSRAAGRRLAAQLDLRGGGRRPARGRAPAQLMPGLPGGTDAAGHHVRRDRPGGAGPWHPPDLVLSLRGRRLARRAHSACHGAGTVVSDFARRGISQPDPRQRSHAAVPLRRQPPPPAPRIWTTRAWTKFSACWSEAGWCGRSPGCARSQYCTKENSGCAMDELRDSGGGCWRRRGGGCRHPARPAADCPPHRRAAAGPARRDAGSPAGPPARRPVAGPPDRRCRRDHRGPSVRRAAVAAPGHRGGRGQHRLAALGLPVAGRPAARRLPGRTRSIDAGDAGAAPPIRG